MYVMSDQTRRRVQWSGLVVCGLALAAVIAGFAFLEFQRSQQLLQDVVELRESLHGEVISAAFVDDSVTDAQLQFARQFPHIETLYFTGTRSVAADLACLDKFPNLKHLELSKVSWMDERAIRDITRLPQLRSLGLSRSNISDNTLSQLAGHKQIRHLNLDGCGGVSDAAIDTLIGLPQLRSVNLNRTGVSLDGWRRLRTSREDVRIICSVDHLIADIFLSCDSSSWSLRSTASAADFRTFLELPHNWETGRWTDKVLFDRVKDLTLLGAAAETSLQDLVPHLTQLYYVYIPAAGLRSFEEGQIGQVRQAGLLNVQTEDDLAHLCDLRLLERLRLEFESPIAPNHLIGQLEGLTSLIDLTLTGPGVDDALLASMRGLPQLKYLSAHEAPITDAGVEALLSDGHCVYLGVWRTDVSAEMQDRLRRRIFWTQ